MSRRWHPFTGRGAVAALVLLAILARAIFVLATPGYVPRVDDRDYFRLGAAISRTGVYPSGRAWVTSVGCPKVPGLPLTPCASRPGAPGAHSVARPTAYRPPAYPYSLALPELVARWVHANPLDLARGFQALLGVLDAALVGVLAGLLWGRRVGLIALGLAAVYLPFVLVSGTLVSEPLYVAFMLGALCAVLRWRQQPHWRWLVAAGVLAGLSALARSNGIIVVLAVALLALAGQGRRGAARSRRLRHGLIVVVAAGLTITPWLVRDAIVFGQFVPISTEGGGTLVGTFNPTSRADRAEPAAWLGLSHIARYRLMYHQQYAHPEPTVDAALRHDAIQFAVDHPTYLGTVLWWNTIRLFDLDGSARTRFGAATVDLPGTPAVVGAYMFYVVALLALGGALLPAVRRAPWALWLLLALQFLTTVFANTETPRFRTPLEPFFLILAACCLERLWAFAVLDRRRGGRAGGRTADRVPA